jgi:hypothetical protein
MNKLSLNSQLIFGLNLTRNIKSNCFYSFILSLCSLIPIFLSFTHFLSQLFVLYSNLLHEQNYLYSIGSVNQSINKLNTSLMLIIWYCKREKISNIIGMIWKKRCEIDEGIRTIHPQIGIKLKNW